jgi:hypothetical protein
VRKKQEKTRIKKATLNLSYSNHSEDRAAKGPSLRAAEDEIDFEREPRSPRGRSNESNVIGLRSRFGKPKGEIPPDKPNVVQTMSDTPSRTEIAAQLQAAEARTETRIAQLGAAIESRAAASDHKIDFLVGKIDVLSTAVMEVKADAKVTRNNIWLAAIAVMGLVVALWVAGLNMQNNLVAMFQAALAIRAVVQDAEPIGPPAAVPLSPAPPAPPGKTK